MLSASKFISCKYHYCVLCPPPHHVPFFSLWLMLPPPSSFPLQLLHTNTQVFPLLPTSSEVSYMQINWRDYCLLTIKGLKKQNTKVK